MPGGRQSVLPWILAVLVTVLSLLVVLKFDQVERQRLREEERNSLLSQLDTVRARMEAAINGPMLRARGIVAYIVTHGDITPEVFENMAAVLLDGHRSVRNMVVSRGMVIAMTYPLAGNESVIGVDYSAVPEQEAMVRKTIERRAPLLQGPVPLIQGGTGLIARTPVFLPASDGGPERFFGMVNVVLDIPRVWADAGIDAPDLPFQLAIRGRDGLGAEGELIWGDEAVFRHDPAQIDVALPLGSWRMAAIPRGGWEAVDGGMTTLRALGGLVFLLMAFTAFGTARHITRRAAVEQALRAKTLELERSNADLESFAYATSHDLQTPLRNIVSYAQLLERRYHGKLGPDADDYIGFLVGNATRLSTLVRDLLDYARIADHAAHRSALGVAEAVAEALRNLDADVTASGGEVSVGALPALQVDARVTSVFQNLIGNALRYARPGVPPRVRVTAEVDESGRWVFTVADNGIGIEPQYFDRIFGLFQRLDAPGPGSSGGSGVGLAVCKRIIHQFGGEIWVESAPGEGSRFRFTLPAAGRAAAAE
ncbi:sensor histidine kinase [Caenispirillum bisanense]|uniref:histidine kinase n=1 Tax=Caenispirillum bisanense TaxID=414052 RepID=A0A286GZV7_9PROT|nr:ATP-binding protein [Caenispirillum bisanense]SOE00594.1 two-component system, sensor histidine kinase ChiS [Caenispirillum bisanense]